MAKLSAYLRSTDGGYSHWCPGCEEMHYIAVQKPLGNGARWTFDGNVITPTFHPSVKIEISNAGEWAVARCHYFLKKGRIEFCGDCTHELKGQKVPLPPLPEDL